ncbi:MAG: acyloxyacyl hydrolase [Hyphomicrobiaceae bacterium]|nr:MAG: acyloxyacyl hydrolase [Hyphomicrobiaceae bacterium]
MAGGARDQSRRRLPRRPGRGETHDQAPARQDHQHLLDHVRARPSDHRSLRGKQRRPQDADAGHGHRLGQIRHPGQRHRSRLLQDRADEAPGGQSSVHRLGGEPHARRPLGRRQGARRGRRVPCLGRLELRERPPPLCRRRANGLRLTARLDPPVSVEPSSVAQGPQPIHIQQSSLSDPCSLPCCLVYLSPGKGEGVALSSPLTKYVRLGLSALGLACVGAASLAPALAYQANNTPWLLRLAEIRFGAVEQNVEGTRNENGLSINGELLIALSNRLRQRSLLEELLQPRILLGGLLNTDRHTSLIYLGLAWELPIDERLFIEWTFGGAIHDGPLSTSDPANVAAFGCRANFYESASAGINIDSHWRLLVTVQHMSNNKWCDPNAGLTNVGVRLGYRLD